MAKYIRCSYCGKRIDIGEEVYTLDGIICCDAHCFTDLFAEIELLSETKAKVSGHEVFDDAERIKELRSEIPKMEQELTIMKLELAGLENPYFGFENLTL